MKPILEMLFNEYIKADDSKKTVNLLEPELEKSRKHLKRILNRKQRKALLRIIDAKDLLKEESNLESFIAGFKTGLRVGYESNQH